MTENPNDTIITFDEPEDEANELDVRQQLEQLKMQSKTLQEKSTTNRKIRIHTNMILSSNNKY